MDEKLKKRLKKYEEELSDWRYAARQGQTKETRNNANKEIKRILHKMAELRKQSLPPPPPVLAIPALPEWLENEKAKKILQDIWPMQRSEGSDSIPALIQELTQFVRDYWQQRQRFPSYAEVADRFQIAGDADANVAFWAVFFDRALPQEKSPEMEKARPVVPKEKEELYPVPADVSPPPPFPSFQEQQPQPKFVVPLLIRLARPPAYGVTRATMGVGNWHRMQPICFVTNQPTAVVNILTQSEILPTILGIDLAMLRVETPVQLSKKFLQGSTSSNPVPGGKKQLTQDVPDRPDDASDYGSSEGGNPIMRSKGLKHTLRHFKGTTSSKTMSKATHWVTLDGFGGLRFPIERLEMDGTSLLPLLQPNDQPFPFNSDLQTLERTATQPVFDKKGKQIGVLEWIVFRTQVASHHVAIALFDNDLVAVYVYPAVTKKEEESEQALDRLIDILSRYEPDDITEEERRYLKRVPSTYFQALLDGDLEDRARQLDPGLQNPKWALARNAAQKWLNYSQASRLVREWFDQMDMAARLQAALMENGLRPNYRRENATLKRLRRTMIRIHMDDKPVRPEDIAEAVPVTDDPEQNLGVWKYFFDDVNTRLEQRKRAPAYPKEWEPLVFEAPRRSRSPVQPPKDESYPMIESPRRSRSPPPKEKEELPLRRSRSPSPVAVAKESKRERDARRKREKRERERNRELDIQRRFGDFMDQVFSGDMNLTARLTKYGGTPKDDAPSVDEQKNTVLQWLLLTWFPNNERWPTAQEMAQGASEGELYDFRVEAFSTPLKRAQQKKKLRIQGQLAIGSCAACAAPNPRSQCSACKAVRYCGQQCADAHWEEHNCRK